MSRAGAQGSEKVSERLAAEAAEQHTAVKRRRIRTLLMVVIPLLAIALFVALDPPAPGTVVPVLAPSHIAAVDDPHRGYTSTPPSSGAHVGGSVPVGLVADEPIEPEAYLHFMEDAGIGLFYDCDDSCSDVDGLAAFMASQRSRRLFVAPFDGITDPENNRYPIAAVAWGRILYLDDLSVSDIEELETFVSIFEGIDHHA